VPTTAAPTADDLRTLPKVELHVHLGGSITESTASELARRHGADPEAYLHLVDGRYPGRYDGFAPFLAAYLATNAFVRTPDDLALATSRFAEAQAAQGIQYSEVIFTAMTYVRNGMEPRAMWEALRSSLAAAGAETRCGIVVDTIRDFGRDEALATLEVVADADAPIVGLGLTGVEGTVPASEFIEYRSEARRMGFGFEVHAGEMGPPSSVVEALVILEADRIGHGVAAIQDPALVERLVREGVVLDVCPSSNVAIGLYPSLEEHPVADLLRAGVAVTVSSDDPPFFRTTLTDELREVARLVKLDRAGVAGLQRRAAEAAFLPGEDREILFAAVDRWLDDVPRRQSPQNDPESPAPRR
jgi:adenosine deaminase